MTYQMWLVWRLHSLVQQVIPVDVPEERMFLQWIKKDYLYILYGP